MLTCNASVAFKIFSIFNLAYIKDSSYGIYLFVGQKKTWEAHCHLYGLVFWPQQVGKMT